ncbi:mechanosensitive ion channel family protein [Sphingobium sp. CR28]|uniref:mechanosensitive ion channel family protein n=1 Tax=Sphingobium sp. CR28 TaxID=3400272 RepID=UPI003FEDFE8B
MNAAQPLPNLPNVSVTWHAVSGWIEVHWLQIAISVAVGVAIYFGLRVVRRTVRKRLVSPVHGTQFKEVIGRTVARTTHSFMILVAARLVAGYADPPVMVLTTIKFLFTIVAAFQVAIWAREIIIGLIERRTNADRHDTLANAMGIIRLLVTVTLFIIAAIVVLDNLGVNVTGLVAGLGIGGIAIGLAAQGIFSDLFAALSIIFDRPFRQGEVITYDQTTARVERIGLKSTRLRAMSGEHKVISNAQLLQKEITSLQTLAQRRVTFTLGLIYQTPMEVLERVPAILKEVAESCRLTFVNAGITGFGASSLNFDLNVDVPDPDTHDYFMSRHRLALAIVARFNAEGIEFAYPTQTTLTAAPDGTLIMPYPEFLPASSPGKAKS